MYTFESRIRYSEVDSEGTLSMAALINYFQDASTFQSEDLGLGVAALKQRHQVWVLSAWQIVVERYPRLGEHVTIGTLPYDMRAFMGMRNFCMLDSEGKYLAKANSIWSLLDTDTQRPVAIPQIMLDAYRLEEKLEMDYAPRKITVPEGGVTQEALVVKKYHLDTNHHVNNQQFIDIAMNYLPDELGIKQVRAEYKMQAHLDDKLIPIVAKQDGRRYVTLQNEDGVPYVVTEFI